MNKKAGAGLIVGIVAGIIIILIVGISFAVLFLTKDQIDSGRRGADCTAVCLDEGYFGGSYEKETECLAGEIEVGDRSKILTCCCKSKGESSGGSSSNGGDLSWCNENHRLVTGVPESSAKTTVSVVTYKGDQRCLISRVYSGGIGTTKTYCLDKDCLDLWEDQSWPSSGLEFNYHLVNNECVEGDCENSQAAFQ